MHVTAEACAALNELLAQRTGTEKCLRLSTVQGNYRFVVDEAIEQDLAFSHDGRVVLIVSETVSRDLWGITIDCSEDPAGKLIFRKAKPGEPLDTVKDDHEGVPSSWKAEQHERLLAEIAQIGQQITKLRGGSKSVLRDQLQVLEASKQEKWDSIRSLWAGDGQWHRKNGAPMPAAKVE